MFTQKRILLGILVILLMVGGGLAYKQLSSTKDTGENVNKVNYGPPTEEEQSAGDKQKAENDAKDAAVNSASTPNGSVQLVLVDAGQYFENVEVRAYTSSVYESGGKCTATFTKGNEKVTVSSTAFKDATTTQCGALDIPRSKFPSAGQWQLVVSYSSASSSGSTQAKAVTLK